MHKVNKYLFVAFILLLVLTIGEIVYYFFFLSSNSNPTTLESTPTTSNSIPAANSPSQAIDQSIINNLSLYKEGFLDSSVLENTIKGTIVRIENNDGSVQFPLNQGQSTAIEYKQRIVIENELGIESTFYFRESDLENTTVTSGDNSPLTFEDLQSGDQITVIERLNLLETWENSFMSYRIIKE